MISVLSVVCKKKITCIDFDVIFFFFFVTEETTLPLSRKTSVSDSIIFKGDLTAENVALNLLKHFSDQKLPKASELEWLVSEQEAPQKVRNLVFINLKILKCKGRVYPN